MVLSSTFSRSMFEPEGDKKLSPNERSKFHFKFPLSLHHGQETGERDSALGNFNKWFLSLKPKSKMNGVSGASRFNHFGLLFDIFHFKWKIWTQIAHRIKSGEFIP